MTISRTKFILIAAAACLSAPPALAQTVARDALLHRIAVDLTARGGILDTYMRNGTKDLTDGDLARLATILEDPVFRKFQASMASPATQRELLQSMMASVLQMGDAINGVLDKHGLHQVH